ncbi:MAG: alpha/beta hydrolase [Campylobacterales bacterium]|nr:alpha/beta hydrolase [Campylobacterales bacterium]
MQERYIKTNGITLNALYAGDKDAPLVILLHGFPELANSRKEYIYYFASHGYQVIAPNQRGYYKSSKPKARDAYRLDQLALDIVGLIKYFNQQKVFLVGHDWGGVVAWYLVTHYTHYLHKVVILNAPHYGVMRDNLNFNPIQKKRSQYMFDFQKPCIHEKRAKESNFSKMVSNLRQSGHPKMSILNERQYYKQAWLRPLAYHSMLNWYRDYLHNNFPYQRSKIKLPILLLWGEKDIFLCKSMARESIELCTNGKLIFFEDATHWVNHEKSDKINQLIAEWFA